MQLRGPCSQRNGGSRDPPRANEKARKLTLHCVESLRDRLELLNSKALERDKSRSETGKFSHKAAHWKLRDLVNFMREGNGPASTAALALRQLLRPAYAATKSSRDTTGEPRDKHCALQGVNLVPKSQHFTYELYRRKPYPIGRRKFRRSADPAVRTSPTTKATALAFGRQLSRMFRHRNPFYVG